MAKIFTPKTFLPASKITTIPDKELRKINEIMKQIPDLETILIKINNDVYPNKNNKGRGQKLSAEQVFKLAYLKKSLGYTDRQIAFATYDSISVMNFLGLGLEEKLKKSLINVAINRITEETWKYINIQILKYAQIMGIDNGEATRIDCTVSQTNIHYPTNFNLLNDFNRVVCRDIKEAIELSNSDVKFEDRTRSSKKAIFNINNLGASKKKRRMMTKLIRIGESVLLTGLKAVELLEAQDKNNLFNFNSVGDGVKFSSLIQRVKYNLELGKKVTDQARRKEINKENVPVEDKIFSLFEAHTDIIVKGKRQIEFGHKVEISSGISGLIHTINVLKGNPADSKIFQEVINEHIEIYGISPKVAATDGCFASAANRDYAKQVGVEELTFCKNRNLDITKLVTNKSHLKILRNFRAGIEADISHLKRRLGLRRIRSKGLVNFKKSVRMSQMAKNLIVIARIELARDLKKAQRAEKKAA